jgi:2',3'-cyclic-nucleotide 2'-phosphodiesterase (5'-nucleotidase family)
MKFQKFLIPLLALLLAVSCHESEEGKLTEVVLLHTNDMHAEINHFARLAHLAEAERRAHEHVFLLSAGDIFSGNPVVDFYEEKGQPMITLMNRLGYEVSTLGNHEFDYGQEVLASRLSEARFPFIAANVETGGTLLPEIAPFHILEAGPVEIMLLGLLETNNNGLPSTHPERVQGINFTDPLEAAAPFVAQAADYDALVGLTHLGFRTDRRLAQRYPAFDLIIGGHSHTLIDRPSTENGVLITQAGDDLSYVGKVVLKFRGEELVEQQASIISLEDWADEDEALAGEIAEFNNNESLLQVIGQAEAPIRGKSELGALFTDALVVGHELDFAFQNDGGIRIAEIPAGEITVRQIYEMDPFGNEVIKFSMTTEEIKSLIRNSFNRRNSPDLRIGGGTYTIRTAGDGAAEEVILRDEAGNDLPDGQSYTVGMNSYIAASYQFEHTDPGTSLYVTTAESIIEFIRQRQPLNFAGIRRVFVE